MSDLFIRSAPFEPATFDANKRSVQVVFSTGSEVLRSDYEGQFIERLDMSPEAVDLSQLRGGPVLDSHNRYEVRGILGVVEDANVDGERGLATVRFSERPDLAGIIRDVQTGILRSLSVGYSVEQWQTTKRADGVRVKTAVRWTPREISFTPIGADPGAKVRSSTKESTMDQKLVEQIRSLVSLAGLSGEFGESLTNRDGGITIEDARKAVFAEAARRVPAIDSRQTAASGNEPSLVSRLADGLRSRIDPRHEPTIGRQYVHHTFRDMAVEILRAHSLSTFGSPAELIERALHQAADLPNVLAEWFNKNLLSLRTAPVPLEQIFRRATAPDFRARHIIEVGKGPSLLLMAEDAQVTFGSVTDKELANYAVQSYARGWSISFKALVNDDLGALSSIGAKMTEGARSWYSGFLANTIIANPALADGLAVFHATHTNLAGVAAAPSDTSLAAARLAMRLQTDVSGQVVDTTPRYIVIRAADEHTFDKLLAAIYPTSSTGAETAARGLVPIVIPNFDKSAHNAWYLFADPAVAPVFEVCSLSGYEGPQVESRSAFDTLGIDTRVVWHLGAAAIDSRGAYKTPGV